VLEGIGVEELVVIPFDRHFAERTAQEFVDGVLVDRLCAERVSIGRNFRFGHHAAGDADMLAADPRFETRVVRLVEVEGETVSSSHIRGLLAAGEVDQATVFLGRPFELRGEIVGGDRRGRELGFPTANLVPDDRLVCPGHGVYACRARIGDGAPLGAAVNVGVRPTFETGRGLLVEAYLLDFEGDIYGRELRIEFLRRLRGERAFESPEALVEQMERDVEEAREVWQASSATVPGR
jgi:riboflavin kinase/FMN adenylyltransferase